MKKTSLLQAPLRPALVALGLAFASGAHAQTPTLAETRVTATRLPDTAQSLPMGVSVVTADQIRASGATTVNDALVRLLGIPAKLDLFGGGEYTLDLRGFGTTADSNQVVIVDGQRISEADTSSTRLSGIPIDSVERIEVLRGSGAVLYGEGATGGVIVITTKAGAGTARRNSASVYAGAGSYGLRDGRASATVAAGGFSLDLATQTRKSNGFRDNGRSQLQADSVGAQWSNAWLRVGGTLSRDDLDTRLPGALTREEFEQNPRQSEARFRDDHANLNSRRHNVFAEADLAGWQLRADAGHRSRTLRSISSGFAYDFDLKADTRSLRARRDAAVGSGMRNTLVAGWDQTEWRRDVLGSFGSAATQRSDGWYVRDDLTLASATRLSAGLRTERIRKDDSSATADLRDRQRAWELGLSQAVGAGVTAYARLGRSFRLAKVDEFSFIDPNTPIRPQTSRDAELGARWAREGSSIEARLWRSKLQDEIGFDPDAVGPSSIFGFNGANTNFDPTRRQGVELDMMQRLSATWNLGVHAAHRRAEFRAGPHAGRDVPLVPRNTLALRADWTPAAGHRISGGVNWVSSQFVDFNNTCSVPRYTLADLRYAWQWQQAEFSLGVANLFDRKFFTQAFACAQGQATSLYPEPGRAFTAAVRVSF